MSSAQDTNSIGRALDGRYRIGEEIGAGGLGAVYRGTHELLDKPVAIKLLHVQYGENPLLRARFEREAKALATLDHPSIVSVTDYGVAGNTPYLVMELLEGATLAQRLDSSGPLDPSIAASLAKDLLRALAFVHGRGLVHRDVKPGNVFLQRIADGSERLKLLDFGLAKFTERANGTADATLTRAGDMLGTPGYMAPEQVGGDDIDARSDVYAAGVILFQMLAGRLPFEGSAVDQLRAHLASPVPLLAEHSPALNVRPEIDAVLQRAMAKRRDERFADADDMLCALDSIEQPWTLAPRPANDRADLLSNASTLVVTPDRELEARVTPTQPKAVIEAAARARRRPVLAIVVCVLSLLGAALYLQRPATPPPMAASSQASKPAVAIETAAPVVEAAKTAPVLPPSPPAVTEKALPPAKNPWAREVPKALRSLRKSLAKGEVGNERTVTTLRRYNQAHDDDVRGHLLLARLYMNREWRTDALNQFSLVMQIDPAARGASEMLPELLRVVAQGAVSNDAGALIVRAYGDDAVSAIERALGQSKADPEATQRLRELRARIASR